MASADRPDTTSTGRIPAPEVWQAFSEQARHRKDAVAVSDGATELTYAELAVRATELAARLPNRDSAEPLTAICLPRSVVYVVAVLAAVRTGGFVPLDPEAPADRRSRILADAAPDCLVGTAEVTAPDGVLRVDPTTGRPGRMASGGDAAKAGGDVAVAGVTDRKLAYVMYTSGTTGTPKGVAVEHAPLARHLRAFGERLNIGPDDRYLFFASPVTDVSVEQVLVPLLHGATLVVRPPGLAEAAVRFWEYVRESRLSVVNVPAGYWRLLATAVDRVDMCEDLRWIVVGSDAVPVDLAYRSTSGGPPRMVNAYGPTETVITASTREVAPSDVATGTALATVPLGTAVGERALRVLDGELNPVAAGEIGEIWLSGLTARGYLHDPGRTAAAFLPDPWAPGARMYRTGDLARLLPDGDAEFVGRVDRQVKVDGFRVEPSAVEVVARSHPAVADCVAVPVSADGRVHLELLLVPTVPAVDLVDVREHVDREVPVSARPRHIHVVDGLPLTSNGKVDQLAARELAESLANDATGPEGAAAGDPPATEFEHALLDMWQEAFGRPGIRLDDDFLELGGDSMTSLAIACAAPAKGWHLRPRDVFEARTVRRLARLLEANGAGGTGDPPDGDATALRQPGGLQAPPAGTGAPATPDATDVQPATPATRWLVERLDEVPAEWCQYVLVDLAPHVDSTLLGRALDEVVSRHAILTSTLECHGDSWRHVPGSELFPTFGPIVRWPDDDAPDPEREPSGMRDLRLSMLSEIDPQVGRMIRARYVEGPAGRRRLLLVAHHVVVDTVSWQMLLRELAEAYRLMADGWGLPASAPLATAGALVQAAVDAVRRGDLDAEIGHWTTVVSTANSGLPPRADSTTGKERDALSITITVPLGDGGSAPHQRSGGATARSAPAEALLAAVLTVWRQRTGRDSCVVEMESTGRTTLPGTGAYAAVGWLTALYPLVVDVAPDTAVTRNRVATAVRGVPGDGGGYGLLRHHHPDERVRDALRLNGPPDLAFNFLGSPSVGAGEGFLAAGGAVASGPLRGGDIDRPCPLVVDAWIRDGDLTATLEFDGAQVAPADADSFAARVRALVAEGGDHEPVAEEFPLTPAQEGILFHTLAGGSPDTYVSQVAVEVTGPLSYERFTTAWQVALRATPSMRTSFVWRRRGGPVQRVNGGSEVPVSVRDSSGHVAPSDPVAALLATERANRFDLEESPLLRVALARMEPDRHVCVITHHHLILDGWSVNLLFDDVLRAYRQLADDPGFELPERPSAARVLEARDRVGQPYPEFWRGLLNDWRPSPLVKPGRERSGVHREITEHIAATAWAGLDRTARAAGMTPATLVHLAWAHTLAWWTGQQDVTFGTVLNGRDSGVPGVAQVSGMLINSLPLRLRLESDRPVAADEVEALLLRLQERQHDSLVQVRAAAGQGPRVSLFDHVLDFGTPATMLGTTASLQAGELSLRPLTSVERTNYGVTVTAYVAEDLELSLNHDDGLLTGEEAVSLLERLVLQVTSLANAARVREPVGGRGEARGGGVQ